MARMVVVLFTSGTEDPGCGVYPCPMEAYLVPEGIDHRQFLESFPKGMKPHLLNVVEAERLFDGQSNE